MHEGQVVQIGTPQELFEAPQKVVESLRRFRLNLRRCDAVLVGNARDDAVKTGDWSTVENRERMNEKMTVSPKPKCAEHLMLICVKDGEHEECFCQSPR